MLLAIFLALIVIAIVHLCEAPLVKKIEQFPTVEERVKLRKKIKPRRWLVTIVSLIVVIGVLCLWNNSQSPGWYENLDNIRPIVCLVVVTFLNLFRSAPGEGNITTKSMLNEPVSTKLVADALQDPKPFGLFLRHFWRDNYERHNKAEGFDESDFVKDAKKYQKVYAVSRPNEITSPEGAVRVNLDNTTWKQDVKDLMLKAKVIYILVDDSPNCIWEIEEAKDLLYKTLFIVDRKPLYLNVRQKLSNSVALPEPPQNSDSFYFMCDDQGGVVIDTFEANKNGYSRMLENAQQVLLDSATPTRKIAQYAEKRQIAKPEQTVRKASLPQAEQKVRTASLPRAEKSVRTPQSAPVRTPQSALPRIPLYLRILTVIAALGLLLIPVLLVLDMMFGYGFYPQWWTLQPVWESVVAMVALYGVYELMQRRTLAVLFVAAMAAMLGIYGFMSPIPSGEKELTLPALCIVFVIPFLYWKLVPGTDHVIACVDGHGKRYLLLLAVSAAILFGMPVVASYSFGTDPDFATGNSQLNALYFANNDEESNRCEEVAFVCSDDILTEMLSDLDINPESWSKFEDEGVITWLPTRNYIHTYFAPNHAMAAEYFRKAASKNLSISDFTREQLLQLAEYCETH